ncbi:MAG TPA: hypothetical protein VGK73_02285 [Polyangiaceae bacterium]
MRSILATAGLFFGVATLVAGGARASDFAGGTLRVVRSDAAADCPDDVTLQSSTLALGTLPPPAPLPLNVEVEFARDEAGYFARVLTSGSSDGVRELRKPGESCAALAEAVSVVLAVVLDLLPPEPPAPAPPPPVVPPAAAPEKSAPPAEPPRPASQPPEFSFTAGVLGGTGYGLLGDAFVGVLAVAGRPRWSRWELALGGLWAPNRTLDYLDASVSVSLWSARAEGCAWGSRSALRPDVAVCLGFLAGSLSGRGEGYGDDFPASDAWFAFEAGAAGRWPFGSKLALRLGISALIPTRQQAFAIAGAGNAFESSDAALLLELGPELTFH